MADISGLKGMRLLVQQPVAIGPIRFDFGQSKRHVLELTFDDNTVMNISISKGAHDDILERLKLQTGVSIEQHVAAQEHVIGEKPTNPGREKALPLDATQEDAVKALREVTGPVFDIDPTVTEPKKLTWKKPNG